MRRITALLLSAVLVLSMSMNAYACDEQQTDAYVLQILFGDEAYRYENNENAEMLLDALFLCSEQSDNQGSDKLAFLKSHKVKGICDLSTINVQEDMAYRYFHHLWEREDDVGGKIQRTRRSILKNTTNKVFDFGTLNKLFGSNKGRCNSFAALLYYVHILSDYLGEEIVVGGDEINPFSGNAYITLNGNRPSFTKQQKRSAVSFKKFSSPDSYGRCGVAFANIGPDMLATEKRSAIGMVKPSGWHTVRYDDLVDGQFLYNRCHLIGYQLCGENANTSNLITGTRYLNNTGMLPFENMVADYIKETENHVLYRVTPVYAGDNLLASGVQIEAYSVEDKGKGICFNVFCYNVQPGIVINYKNGESSKAENNIKYGSEDILPFAVAGAAENNPDLIYEIGRHLDIIFEDQLSSFSYKSMRDQIDAIAAEARAIGDKGETAVVCEMKLRGCAYRYFEVVKNYVPVLLKKEEFFISAFG